MVAHAARESRGLPFTQASFNLFRHEVKRGNRIMGRVFRNEIVAGKFVENSRFELMRRWIVEDFVQMHACPQRTRGILADASDLLIDGLTQFLGQFDSFRTNEDIYELLFPCDGFRCSRRVMIERRSWSNVSIHRHSSLK